MTLELLNLICAQNNIPSNVHLTSNSGRKGGFLELNRVFYNRNLNELEFTQQISLSDMVEHSKNGWDCIYNENSKDTEIFVQNCYDCKHCAYDWRLSYSPCFDTVWGDLWCCPRFEHNKELKK